MCKIYAKNYPFNFLLRNNYTTTSFILREKPSASPVTD